MRNADTPTHHIVIKQNGKEMFRLSAYLLSDEAIAETETIYCDIYTAFAGYTVSVEPIPERKLVNVQNDSESERR